MSYCKIRIIINFLLQSCQILNNNRIDIACNRHDIPLIPYYFYNVPAMIPVVPIQQRNFLWNRMLVNSFLVRNPFCRSDFVYMGRTLTAIENEELIFNMAIIISGTFWSASLSPYLSIFAMCYAFGYCVGYCVHWLRSMDSTVE